MESVPQARCGDRREQWTAPAPGARHGPAVGAAARRRGSCAAVARPGRAPAAAAAPGRIGCRPARGGGIAPGSTSGTGISRSRCRHDRAGASAGPSAAPSRRGCASRRTTPVWRRSCQGMPCAAAQARDAAVAGEGPAVAGLLVRPQRADGQAWRRSSSTASTAPTRTTSGWPRAASVGAQLDQALAHERELPAAGVGLGARSRARARTAAGPARSPAASASGAWSATRRSRLNQTICTGSGRRMAQGEIGAGRAAARGCQPAPAPHMTGERFIRAGARAMATSFHLVCPACGAVNRVPSERPGGRRQVRQLRGQAVRRAPDRPDRPPASTGTSARTGFRCWSISGRRGAGRARRWRRCWPWRREELEPRLRVAQAGHRRGARDRRPVRHPQHPDPDPVPGRARGGPDGRAPCRCRSSRPGWSPGSAAA